MIRPVLFFLCSLAVLTSVPRHASSEPAIDGSARIVARALAEAVTARDADAAAVLCALPTNLDGDVVTSSAELRRRWEQTFAPDALRGLVLQQVEVLRRDEAIETHGSPPERLGPIEEDAIVAILRWNRALLVAVIARRDDRWAVVAVTD